MSVNYQTFFHLFSDSYGKSSKAMNMSVLSKAITLSVKNYISVRVSNPFKSGKKVITLSVKNYISVRVI